MRGCSGFVVGIIIGAALGFALLATVALTSGGGAVCATTQPPAWAMRADLPTASLQAEIVGQTLALPAIAAITIREVRSRPCRRALVYADVTGVNGWRLQNVGLEATFAADQAGKLSVQPTTIWFGRLPVPIGWIPRAQIEPGLGQVEQALDQGLRQAVAGSGLRICGLASSDTALSVYLCPET